MFKFVKIIAKYPRCKEFEPHWYLLIENMVDLFKYFDIQNPVMVKTYFHLKQEHNDRSLGHLSGILENAVGGLFMTNNNNRKSFIDDINHISDSFSKPKINMVLGRKRLLIGENLIGFMPYDKKCHTSIDREENKNLIFPTEKYTKKDIRILSWTGGKHFYAKIGRIDVFIDGKQKWDTEKEAMKNAKKFLENL